MKDRILRVTLVLLLPTLLLAGCAPVTNGPSDSGVTPAKETTPAPEEPADDATDAGANPVVIYLMRDDEKVHPMLRDVEGSGVAAGALEALFEGPTDQEQADGNTSSIPEGTRLLGVTIDQGIATVDVSTEFGSGGGSLSMMSRIAQVVFTATQFDTVDSVVFEMEGEPLDVLGGEGIMLEGPQTRAQWEEFAPVILVETPPRGDSAVMGEPLRVAGSANVFEAAFLLEVTDGDGLILVTEPVQATSGTGTRGTFDVGVELIGGKTGQGAVIVSYASPKDGSRIVVDEIPITFK